MKPAAALLSLAILLAALPAGGCHKAPSPPAQPATQGAGAVVSGARLVLPAVSGNPAALYFTLANPGQSPIKLTGVSVAQAKSVELHETSGGEMRPLGPLALDAGSAVSFAPGGKHGMVFGLDPVPQPGAKRTITLWFDKGNPVSAEAQVERPGDMDSEMDAMPGMKMDDPGQAGSHH